MPGPLLDLTFKLKGYPLCPQRFINNPANIILNQDGLGRANPQLCTMLLEWLQLHVHVLIIAMSTTSM